MNACGHIAYTEAVRSAIAVVAYGLDKRYAQRERWRIPERTL